MSAPDPLMLMRSMPGHLIRRAKQKTTQAFTPVAERFGITPIQYAVLQTLAIRSGIDQAELGELVGLDTSTVGEVVARLEQRGLISRQPDGRRQRLRISDEAATMLEQLMPMLSAVQSQITQPLTAREGQQLMRLLSKMLGVANLHFQPRGRGRRGGRSG